MLSRLVPQDPAFRTAEEVRADLKAACRDRARFLTLGKTVQGRPVDAVLFGEGEKTVSLVAGAHADEPVGPETLRTLVRLHEELGTLLDRFRFLVIPHINPDGEAANRAWIERWPDPSAYRANVVREQPGRDIEFGYPRMRIENAMAASLWRVHAPFALHMSLHGMALAEGAMLLVEKSWIDRTGTLRAEFAAAAADAGLGLHDHDRKGEKGFAYIGPGFSTTPRGEAMREHFADRPRIAEKFHDSSMEYVRRLGGDPLCLVTELPLFVVKNPDPQPGLPTAYLALRDGADPADFEIAPLDLGAAMRLQLRTLELALDCVG
jgi:hypothetical protein